MLGATRYVDFWNQKLPGGEIHIRPSTVDGSRDKKGLFSRYDSSFSFSHSEKFSCREWLSNIGLSEEDEFVCLLVRDSAFLSRHPRLGGYVARLRSGLIMIIGTRI